MCVCVLQWCKREPTRANKKEFDVTVRQGNVLAVRCSSVSLRKGEKKERRNGRRRRRKILAKTTISELERNEHVIEKDIEIERGCRVLGGLLSGGRGRCQRRCFGWGLENERRGKYKIKDCYTAVVGFCLVQQEEAKSCLVNQGRGRKTNRGMKKNVQGLRARMVDKDGYIYLKDNC